MTVRWGLAGLAVLLVAGPADAAPVETERMTWTEIRDAVAAGKTTIIIPTGGTEQNGPHMVTGKHNFIVAETARRIAAKLGDALVAPVLAYVPEGNVPSREGHMAYPGTISVPPNVFAKVLKAAAESFKVHGFKTIVFLGDSGPNQEPQHQVASDLSRAWAAEGVRVLNPASYYSENGQVESLKAEGETDAAIGLHASIRDTSELMAVFPEGVRADKLAADADGVTGDPRRASAERGQKLLDLKVEAALRDIRASKERLPGTNTAIDDASWFRRLLHWISG